MKKTILLFICITSFVCTNATTKNTNLPKFVNKKVIQSLNYKAEGKKINYNLSTTENKALFTKLAKLNALHQYYNNLWNKNKGYTILPTFLKRMLALDNEIRNDAGTFKDVDLYNLTPRKYPQHFTNNKTTFHKTQQQIENEIDSWLAQFDTPKSIKAITSIFNVGEVEAEDNLADRICGIGYMDWASTSPVRGFEKSILKHLGVPEDSPDREKHISKFFNDNNSKLICGEDTDDFIREEEHILKRSIALSEYDFLLHAANNSKYELDWNFFEMVDGKKETILDYLDMIIADEELALEFDVDELKTLVGTLEEAGAKRGRDL